MSTTIVRLAGAALLGLAAATGAAAQDAGPDARPHEAPAPRLRRFAPENIFQFRDLAQGPRLGIMAEETADGVRVKEVLAETMAEQAGLRADDLLLRIGDLRIARIDDIREALRRAAPGDEVTVAVVRQGEGVVELTGRVPEPPAGTDGHRGGMLGVTLDERDGRVAVTDVVTESGAWFAGVEPGDVLLSIDGEAVGGPDDVVGKVSSHAPGEWLDLVVERAGETVTLRARLGSRRGADRLLGFLGSPGAGSTGRRLRLLESMPHGMVAPQGPLGLHWRYHDGDGALPGMQDLHEWMEGLDLGDAHDLRIRIEDGVMTIERDGKVETYQLDGDRPSAAPPRVRSTDDPQEESQGVGFRALDTRKV